MFLNVVIVRSVLARMIFSLMHHRICGGAQVLVSSPPMKKHLTYRYCEWASSFYSAKTSLMQAIVSIHLYYFRS